MPDTNETLPPIDEETAQELRARRLAANQNPGDAPGDPAPSDAPAADPKAALEIELRQLEERFQAAKQKAAEENVRAGLEEIQTILQVRGLRIIPRTVIVGGQVSADWIITNQ